MTELNEEPPTKRKRDDPMEEQEQAWRERIMKKLGQYDAPPKKVEETCENLIKHIKKTKENVYIPYHLCAKTFAKEDWDFLYGDKLNTETMKEAQKIIDDVPHYKNIILSGSTVPITDKTMGADFDSLVIYLIEEDGYDAQTNYGERCCDCDVDEEYNGTYIYTVTLYNMDDSFEFDYIKHYETDAGGGRVHFHNITDYWDISYDTRIEDEKYKKMRETLCDILKKEKPDIYKRCGESLHNVEINYCEINSDD